MAVRTRLWVLFLTRDSLKGFPHPSIGTTITTGVTKVRDSTTFVTIIQVVRT